MEQKRQGGRAQQPTPEERARDLIDLLVPDWWDWWPAVWFTVRRAIVPFVLLLIILTLVSSPFGVTLWDWVQLLIIPAVIAGGGVWFNRQQRECKLKIAEQRAQDDAAQSYLDQMTQLLVVNNLHKALSDYMTREVVHARTLHVRKRLDRDSEEVQRKRVLLQFLYKTGLLTQGQPAERVSDENYGILFDTDLKSSNLENLVLRKARLIGANLRDVNLRGADLSDANLTDADLSGADLTDAIVSAEQLNACKSLEGAIMPDGSRYT